MTTPMSRADATAMVDGFVRELLPRTRIADFRTVHVDVRENADLDAWTQVWRAPGWEQDFCEIRDDGWDRRPETLLVFTTGLVEGLTPSQVRAVIAHELAHAEAGDHRNPHWPSAAQSRSRERRADLRAIEICGDGPSLAVGLLRLFRDLRRETPGHRLTHGGVDTRAATIGAAIAADLGL